MNTWKDVVKKHKDVDNSEYLKLIESMPDEWVRELIKMAVEICAITPLEQIAKEGTMSESGRVLAAFVHILCLERAQIFVDGHHLLIGNQNNDS